MRGVTACTLNCLRTSKTAPNTPPAKKNNCAGSRIRVSRTQSAAFSALNPGNHQWIYHGATTSATRMAPPSTRYIVVKITDSDRSPSRSRPVSRYRVRMVTNVIEAAPPTRKYEIMSGSTKAPFNASASTPRPNSHTMYLTLTSPTIRERKVETISTTVAENTECACEGRSIPTPRAQRDCAAEED